MPSSTPGPWSGFAHVPRWLKHTLDMYETKSVYNATWYRIQVIDVLDSFRRGEDGGVLCEEKHCLRIVVAFTAIINKVAALL